MNLLHFGVCLSHFGVRRLHTTLVPSHLLSPEPNLNRLYSPLSWASWLPWCSGSGLHVSLSTVARASPLGVVWPVVMMMSNLPVVIVSVHRWPDGSELHCQIQRGKLSPSLLDGRFLGTTGCRVLLCSYIWEYNADFHLPWGTRLPVWSRHHPNFPQKLVCFCVHQLDYDREALHLLPAATCTGPTIPLGRGLRIAQGCSTLCVDSNPPLTPSLQCWVSPQPSEVLWPAQMQAFAPSHSPALRMLSIHSN